MLGLNYLHLKIDHFNRAYFLMDIMTSKEYGSIFGSHFFPASLSISSLFTLAIFSLQFYPNPVDVFFFYFSISRSRITFTLCRKNNASLRALRTACACIIQLPSRFRPRGLFFSPLILICHHLATKCVAFPPPIASHIPGF